MSTVPENPTPRPSDGSTDDQTVESPASGLPREHVTRVEPVQAESADEPPPAGSPPGPPAEARTEAPPAGPPPASAPPPPPPRGGRPGILGRGAAGLSAPAIAALIAAVLLIGCLCAAAGVAAGIAVSHFGSDHGYSREHDRRDAPFGPDDRGPGGVGPGHQKRVPGDGGTIPSAPVAPKAPSPAPTTPSATPSVTAT